MHTQGRLGGGAFETSAGGGAISRSWRSFLWSHPTVTENAILSSYRYGNELRVRGHAEVVVELLARWYS